MPTIHQLKPAISPELSAVGGCPSPLSLRVSWNEHLGQPELLIGGTNDIKCHHAPFQIKTRPDFSRREKREENGPKYLKNYCIFLSLNSYNILRGRACHFQGGLSLSLQSGESYNSRVARSFFWLHSSLSRIQRDTLVSQQGRRVRQRCWLSIRYSTKGRTAVSWHFLLHFLLSSVQRNRIHENEIPEGAFRWMSGS